MTESEASVIRQTLIESLRGQEITVPDLWSILGRDWAFGINPNVDLLRRNISKTLGEDFTGKRLNELLVTDTALFAACWWPYATPERLRVATWLSIWLFVWDDNMDSEEFSRLSQNFETGSVFRHQTREMISSALSLSSVESSCLRKTKMCEIFERVCQKLRSDYSQAKRQKLLKELNHFIDMTEREQKVALSQPLPSINEYMARRMGSSAVAVCLSISEFCYEIELPDQISDHPAMSELWKATNAIVSIVNDILSLGKELKAGQVDTLVPLLYAASGSIQEAVDKAASMLRDHVAIFNVKKQTLKTLSASRDNETFEAVVKFISSCEYACTANLYWSLRSGRYRLKLPEPGKPLKIRL